VNPYTKQSSFRNREALDSRGLTYFENGGGGGGVEKRGNIKEGKK